MVAAALIGAAVTWAITRSSDRAGNHSHIPTRTPDPAPGQHARSVIPQKTPVELKVYVSAMYVGLGPFLACLFGGIFFSNKSALLIGVILAAILLIAAYAISFRRFSDLLGQVTPELWVSIIALLLIPIAFVTVPVINDAYPDLGWPNIGFNIVSLLVGGVALFMGIKDPGSGATGSASYSGQRKIKTSTPPGS